jgi:hypothetical protein
MDDLQNKYCDNSGYIFQLQEYPEWRFYVYYRGINPFHDRIPQFPNESYKIIIFDNNLFQSRSISSAQFQLTTIYVFLIV